MYAITEARKLNVIEMTTASKNMYENKNSYSFQVEAISLQGRLRASFIALLTL